MSPDAQIDAVPADFNEADRRLAQARNHHRSAQADGIDNESAYILLLGQEHAQLMTRLDRARQQRNRVASQTQAVSRAELEALRGSALHMIDAAQGFVDARRS